VRFIMGSTAYNIHVQQIALSLYEAGVLDIFYTGMVDNYQGAVCKNLRKFTEKRLPGLDAQLKRRRINSLPDDIIYKDWGWDLLRILADRAHLPTLALDWIWEKSEHSLDKRCARLIENTRLDGFFGIEHGALASIESAKNKGKKSVVAFLSLHHSVQEKWLNGEYDRFPELLTKATGRLIELGKIRDARRDKEASLADIICTNSNLVTQSLTDAGIAEDKIITVPLASPEAVAEEQLPRSPRTPFRFMYAGPISVRKGAHYLLEAWKQFSRIKTVELHFYGLPLFPERCFPGLGENVIFHGSVTRQELCSHYQRAGILIFPTLCDGFGMVITEALAHGLPVITTKRAGASELIEDGKNGFLIPPGDTKALRERMEWCLKNPKELLSMRHNALDSAKQYRWSDFRNLLREELKKKAFL